MGHPHVQVERIEAVCLIKVDDERANAFSTALVQTLSEEIAMAEVDEEIGAVVIAGNQKAFFAGFDLGIIRTGDRKKIVEMTSAGGSLIRQAYGSKIPVVAACTGHAVAAGALMLLGCDYRVGTDALVKIGLNEVAIGLMLPKWALAIANERIATRYLQVAVVNAKLMTSDIAVDAGFLDEVVAAGKVVERAVEVAQGFAMDLDSKSYEMTVKAMRGSVLNEMDSGIASDRTAAGLSN